MYICTFYQCVCYLHQTCTKYFQLLQCCLHVITKELYQLVFSSLKTVKSKILPNCHNIEIVRCGGGGVSEVFLKTQLLVRNKNQLSHFQSKCALRVQVPVYEDCFVVIIMQEVSEKRV